MKITNYRATLLVFFTTSLFVACSTDSSSQKTEETQSLIEIENSASPYSPSLENGQLLKSMFSQRNSSSQNEADKSLVEFHPLLQNLPGYEGPGPYKLDPNDDFWCGDLIPREFVHESDEYFAGIVQDFNHCGVAAGGDPVWRWLCTFSKRGELIDSKLIYTEFQDEWLKYELMEDRIKVTSYEAKLIHSGGDNEHEDFSELVPLESHSYRINETGAIVDLFKTEEEQAQRIPEDYHLGSIMDYYRVFPEGGDPFEKREGKWVLNYGPPQNGEPAEDCFQQICEFEIDEPNGYIYTSWGDGTPSENQYVLFKKEEGSYLFAHNHWAREPYQAGSELTFYVIEDRQWKVVTLELPSFTIEELISAEEWAIWQEEYPEISNLNPEFWYDLPQNGTDLKVYLEFVPSSLQYVCAQNEDSPDPNRVKEILQSNPGILKWNRATGTFEK